MCIVGAGAAGLTIAGRLARAGIPCVVLEAGGARPDRRSQSFYWARRAGMPNHSYFYSRFRALGGSTSYWTGQCVALEEADFLGRGEAVPAWPFPKSTLDPYYDRAAQVLDLPPPGTVLRALAPGDLLTREMETAAFHEVRLAQSGTLAHRLLSSDTDGPGPRVILNAAVTDIRTEPPGQRVRSVVVRLPGERTMTCEADVFVLAAGGIETARLLLASNREAPRGLGNVHDLVGRYFMDHAYMYAGTVAKAPEALCRLAVGGFGRQRDRFGGFAALRMREAGTNAAALFLFEQPAFALRPDVADAQGRSLIHLSQILRGERFFGRDTWPRLADLGRRPDRVLTLVAARAASAVRPRTVTAVRLFAETTPRHDSRVRLIRDRDPHGMPCVEVDWRVEDEDKRGPAALLAALRGVLSAQGAELRGGAEFAPGQAWPATFTGGKHHMGTTRMSADPRRGVVDPDGRVHGIPNLYLAGSSVFPSSGWANPTFTIVALALRLSDRLERLVSR